MNNENTTGNDGQEQTPEQAQADHAETQAHEQGADQNAHQETTTMTETQTPTPEKERTPHRTIEQFVSQFATGTLPKRAKVSGNYRLSPDIDDKGNIIEGVEVLRYECSDGKDDLAVRFADGRIIFNASTLRFCGTKMAWGHRTQNWSGRQAMPQRIMSEAGLLGLPFQTIRDLGMNIYALNIVDKGPEEELDLPNNASHNQVAGMMRAALKKSEGEKAETLAKVLAQYDKMSAIVKKHEGRGYYYDKAQQEALVAALKAAGFTLPELAARNEQEKEEDDDRANSITHTTNFGMEFKSVVGLRIDVRLTEERSSYYSAEKDKTRRPNYWVTLKWTNHEKRHFIGACLFSSKGKFLLFDIDRGELKHRLFNPFIVEIKGKPKSIAQAYEMLKPKEVVLAERKKLKVLRQGEWFFIPVKGAPKQDTKHLAKARRIVARGEPSLNSAIIREGKGGDSIRRALGLNVSGQLNLSSPGDYYVKSMTECGVSRKSMMAYNRKRAEYDAAVNDLNTSAATRGELRAGPNRPNRVEKFVRSGGKAFVSGTVSHTGREHKDIELKGWYLAVPNTAISSFQVSGDID